MRIILICFVTTMFLSSVVLASGNRAVVVGFDGLSWPLLQEMMEAGELPHFARMASEGVSGVLETVVPPSSPPAWVSAVTGTNPGKHGIYGFITPMREWSNPLKPSFSLNPDRTVPAIWNILSRRGRRAGIINIPITYPPDRLNGFMISGFPMDPDGSYIYPERLASRLSDYRIDIFANVCREGQEEPWLADLNEIIEERKKAALMLMDSEDWDLFWVVFTFPDRIQHFFWKYRSSDHPNYDPEKAELYGDQVDKAYKRADSILGLFMERAERLGVPVVVLSDHGFGPVYHTIRANRAVLDASMIDQETGRAKVYYSDFFGGKFFINLKGRDPTGCVEPGEYEEVRERLIEKLNSLKDPGTGTPLVQRIWKKEELYHGPKLENAPDVLCLETPGYLFSKLGRDKSRKIIYDPPKDFFSGFHRLEGILLAHGPGIARGKTIENAHIIDVTPTILQLMNEPSLKYMDGKVIRDIFEKEVPDLPEDESGAEEFQVSGQDKAGVDEDVLKEQLKSLGYVR